MSGTTLLKPLNSSKRDWRSPIRKMACCLSFLLWLALLQTSLAVNVPGPNGTVVTQILSATSSNPEVKVVEDRDLGKILVYPPQPKEFTVEIIARIMYPDDQYLEKISTVMVGATGVTIESDEIRNSLILATLKVAPGASGGRFSITYENEDNPNHKGCNVRLLPVDVAVDANRDGVIKFDGSDKTTADKPYQFWVNDDHDIGHTVDSNDWEEDDVEVGNDSLDHSVKFLRDLEDFTRIKIDLRSMLPFIKGEYPLTSNDFDLKANFEIISGDPQINVFLAYESDGGLEYLKDGNVGYQQIQQDYKFQITNIDGQNTLYPLTKAMFQAKNGDGYAYLLFEGRKKGLGKLNIKLTKGSQVIGGFPPLYIDLKDVTEMYETWTVGDVDASGVQWDTWPSSSATQTSGANLPEPKTLEEKDYVMFVHGWNMPPWEKEAFASTMFKRLWHQGYKGRFGAFRWPTFHGLAWNSFHTAHFDGSEQRAWNSATPLKSLLINRASQFKDDDGKSLVRLYAHSMGNVVASESLRQMPSAPTSPNYVHTYISAQAALSAHVWDNRTNEMDFNWSTPDVYGYYWIPGATLSTDLDKWETEGRESYMDARYMSTNVRYINHYNPDDWALAEDKWQLNQKLKPDAGYQYERVGLSSTIAFTHNTSLLNEEILSFPDDRYEIFSYAAESRAFATGAESSVGGKFSDTVNLRDDFSFEAAHKGHSAQFRSYIQKRWDYWSRFLEDMRIVVPDQN